MRTRREPEEGSVAARAGLYFGRRSQVLLATTSTAASSTEGGAAACAGGLLRSGASVVRTTHAREARARQVPLRPQGDAVAKSVLGSQLLDIRDAFKLGPYTLANATVL